MSKSKFRNVLFAYEESNDKIDPWIERFRNVLHAANYKFDEVAARELPSIDLKKYDLLVVYGAVMAFSFKEPIRDWLSSEKRLSGMKVGLFVTANRWFLKEYYGQLTSLLQKNETTIIDAVSSATETLKEDDKAKLIMNFIGRVNQ